MLKQGRKREAKGLAVLYFIIGLIILLIILAVIYFALAKLDYSDKLDPEATMRPYVEQAQPEADAEPVEPEVDEPEAPAGEPVPEDEVDLTEVVRVEDHGDRKTVTTADGETREARSVILATGVRHRELGLTGEREMTGEGVSYCAVCDADFFRGKKVCVAGGGNSALQEAMLLAGKCSEVVMLQDLPEFTGEKKLQELLFSKPNVSARTGVKIVDLGMDEHVQLNAVTVEKADGTRETIPCDGLFVAIGLIPENEAFREVAKLDENGYFASPETCETGTPGIFAAGDCRAKSVRQLTTAAADGSVAALAACRYVDALQG